MKFKELQWLCGGRLTLRSVQFSMPATNFRRSCRSSSRRAAAGRRCSQCRRQCHTALLLTMKLKHHLYLFNSIYLVLFIHFVWIYCHLSNDFNIFQWFLHIIYCFTHQASCHGGHPIGSQRGRSTVTGRAKHRTTGNLGAELRLSLCFFLHFIHSSGAEIEATHFAKSFWILLYCDLSTPGWGHWSGTCEAWKQNGRCWSLKGWKKLEEVGSISVERGHFSSVGGWRDVLGTTTASSVPAVHRFPWDDGLGTWKFSISPPAELMERQHCKQLLSSAGRDWHSNGWDASEFVWLGLRFLDTNAR